MSTRRGTSSPDRRPGPDPPSPRTPGASWWSPRCSWWWRGACSPGDPVGLSRQAAGAGTCQAVGICDAWVLLVEILR
ncbi:MAG TPA: hypothetical protein VLZ77_11580 [Acidimicrobiales bacterium]|nr:hypothetical protein [Acidimicrobiales bacterium]